ncbi:helix-turn-helix domain-containing protein [Nocardia thailandica]
MSLERGDKAVLSISSVEAAQARRFVSEVEQLRPSDALRGAGVTVGVAGGASVAMPEQLAALVSQVLDLVAKGCTVTVGSIPEAVTTTVAARMLGVSRPTLMKLVGDGVIPAHKVGSHTRLLSADVAAYRRQQRADQREAFAELRAFEDELGVVD